MNRDTMKVQEKGQYADLKNDEVDGHLLAGEKIENLGVVGGTCWEFLELSNSATARKAELEL